MHIQPDILFCIDFNPLFKSFREYSCNKSHTLYIKFTISLQLAGNQEDSGQEFGDAAKWNWKWELMAGGWILPLESPTAATGRLSNTSALQCCAAESIVREWTWYVK